MTIRKESDGEAGKEFALPRRASEDAASMHSTKPNPAMSCDLTTRRRVFYRGRLRSAESEDMSRKLDNHMPLHYCEPYRISCDVRPCLDSRSLTPSLSFSLSLSQSHVGYRI
ncbi:hypothetical protein MPTK1_5g07080 [Marchantia polymorpha subsp. ruderalis]